jgi:putative membrane protein
MRFWKTAAVVAVVSVAGVATAATPTEETIRKLAQDGYGEVKTAQLAKTRATNEEVKRFADRMIADHQKANDELLAIAKKKGFSIHTNEASAEANRNLEKLEKLKGQEFDREYARIVLEDHKKDVAELERATKVDDAELKQWAEKTLAVVREHLKMAEALNEKVKG